MGLRSDGKDITLDGRGYTARTKDLKAKFGVGIGRITDFVTLYQTGTLYKTLELYTDQGFVFVKSPLPYAADLLKRTGEYVFGLTNENKTEYAFGAFLTNLKPKVIEIMKLNFV